MEEKGEEGGSKGMRRMRRKKEEIRRRKDEARECEGGGEIKGKCGGGRWRSRENDN